MAQGMVSVQPNSPYDFRQYNYTNSVFTGSTISVIKQGGGVLHGFIVQTTGAAASSNLLIIDSTASAVNTLYSFSGTATATNVLGIDLAFTTALSVQSQSTTSTTPTVTIIWK